MRMVVGMLCYVFASQCLCYLCWLLKYRVKFIRRVEPEIPQTKPFSAAFVRVCIWILWQLVFMAGCMLLHLRYTFPLHEFDDQKHSSDAISKQESEITINRLFSMWNWIFSQQRLRATLHSSIQPISKSFIKLSFCPKYTYTEYISSIQVSIDPLFLNYIDFVQRTNLYRQWIN